MAATEAKRQSNRWPALLNSAAARFAEQGYHATTIRELAAATAMTPGAIYFHVANKQALLLAVYEEGVQRILERLEAAVAKQKEPWARLESAVEAHLEIDPRRERLRPRRHPDFAGRRARDRLGADEIARSIRGAISLALFRDRLAPGSRSQACSPVRPGRDQLDAGLVSVERKVDTIARPRTVGAGARAVGKQIRGAPK